MSTERCSRVPPLRLPGISSRHGRRPMPARMIGSKPSARPWLGENVASFACRWLSQLTSHLTWSLRRPDISSMAMTHRVGSDLVLHRGRLVGITRIPTGSNTDACMHRHHLRVGELSRAGPHRRQTVSVLVWCGTAISECGPPRPQSKIESGSQVVEIGITAECIGPLGQALRDLQETSLISVCTPWGSADTPGHSSWIDRR